MLHSTKNEVFMKDVFSKCEQILSAQLYKKIIQFIKNTVTPIFPLVTFSLKQRKIAIFFRVRYLVKFVKMGFFEELRISTRTSYPDKTCKRRSALKL